jgi:hypothetical protein
MVRKLHQFKACVTTFHGQPLLMLECEFCGVDFTISKFSGDLNSRREVSEALRKNSERVQYAKNFLDTNMNCDELLVRKVLSA